MSRLQDLIAMLLDNVPDSAMAAIVGLDGLPVAYVKRSGSVDPERVAAEFTAAVRAILRASSRAQAGQPASLGVNTDQSRGLVRLLGDEFFLLLLTGPAVNDVQATAAIDRVVPAVQAVLRRQGEPPPAAGNPARRPPLALSISIFLVATLLVGLLWVGLHRRGVSRDQPAAMAPSGSQAAAPRTAASTVTTGSASGPPATAAVTAGPTAAATSVVPAAGVQGSATPAATTTTASSRVAAAAQAVQDGTPSPGVAYFPQTGHHLSGVFKAYWEQYGGLEVFGYPITEELQERDFAPPLGDGSVHTVQYFERARFEDHNEFTGTPNQVLLGLLGREQSAPERGTQPFQPVAQIASTPEQRYFAATGHTLQGPFLTYWRQHGGLAIFGFPISEPFIENGFTVQYFERERLEYHPEFENTPYEVLLGRLGQQALASYQRLSP